MVQISENYRRIRSQLPPEVRIVAAAKNRTADEVAEVIEAGASIIGENYVQEAERLLGSMSGKLPGKAELHLIGHLQRNKVNKALANFDMIQSLDSLSLARAINRRIQEGSEALRALVQINVAGEESKSGITPEELNGFLFELSQLRHIKVMGLMTMEPYCENPERARPYFRKMRELFFGASKLQIPGVKMHTLSMGMTNSYAVAVEEGANMVRIGTAIFGPR